MNLKDLQQYEKYFYRAPSAHNTQPWVLMYGEDTISLTVDKQRMLPDSDPTNRDLLLSLGAFIETTLIVAAQVNAGLEFVPNIDLAKGAVGCFKKSAQPYITPFTLEDIKKRQTSRLVFKEGRLDPQVAGEVESQAGGFQIQLLESRTLIDLFKVSDQYVFHHASVLKELRQWLRLNKGDPRYFMDGLNSECLNLDGFQSVIFNCIIKSLESGYGRILKLDKLLTFFSIDLIRQRCDVMVLKGVTNDGAGVVKAGRALQRVWLALAQAGYFTHPLSQIIDCPDTHAALSARLGLKKDERIFSIFRVGRSPKPAYSHRISS